MHRSAVGIHQPLRVDPQEAGFLAGVQDHLDLDRIPDDRLPVTCMGDPPGVDLDHLGLVGPVEPPAKEELLSDSDVPVFHDLSIPFLLGTLHQVGVFVTVLAESIENILEPVVDTCRTDAVRSVDPLDS